jgi:Winged helix-turn-helix DNA-binding
VPRAAHRPSPAARPLPPAAITLLAAGPARPLRSRPVPQHPRAAPRPASSWTFLSNHAYVLACLAADPTATMRAVAPRVGITERAVQRIVAELAAEGYLTVTRVGRQNRYAVHRKRQLRHPLEAHSTVGDLLGLATPPAH